MNIDTVLGNSPAATKAQVLAAFDITLAVCEAVRVAGEVPAGTLYATLCSRVDLRGFESMLRTLKGAGLVEETPAHLLRWIGPELAGGAK